MTLSPLDTFDIEPVDGPHYKVGATCASPLCNRWADHAHHLFRRSRQGDARWVRLPDGTITGNLVPLCARCHLLVTGTEGGHVHAVRWHEDEYWWANVISQPASASLDYVLIAPLTEQPPRQGEEEPQDMNLCPACGRKKKKTMQHAPPRRRKTWTVKVPDDDAEDGAQVLDDYVDALAYEFGFDVDGGALTRYHVLARACAFAIQHRHDIPEEAKER